MLEVWSALAACARSQAAVEEGGALEGKKWWVYNMG